MLTCSHMSSMQRVHDESMSQCGHHDAVEGLQLGLLVITRFYVSLQHTDIDGIASYMYILTVLPLDSST